MNYEEQLVETENGFSVRLCMAQLVQHSLEPRCSLLASAQRSGLLFVGASQQDRHAALLFHNVSDVINACKASAALLELHSLPHTAIPLPAPPLSVLWSPTEELAAIATVDGHIFIHTSAALSQGDSSPFASTQAPSIRQIAITGENPHLLVVTQTSKLLLAPIGPYPLTLTKSREHVNCVACSPFLTAIGCSYNITFSQITSSGTWEDLLTEPIPYASSTSPHLDALAFVAPDALAVHMLALESQTSSKAGNDEDDLAILELNSPSQPTQVIRGLLGPLRFHALDTPVRRPSSSEFYFADRGPMAGPYMHVAVFPSDAYPAAIVASAIREAEHFMHVFRNDKGEWEEIVCSVDGLQAKLPNTQGESADELFVPNFVVGATAVSTHAGERVVHPRDESCPPAEVCPLLRTIFAWCPPLFVVPRIV
jgi:hypothetical protein